MTRMDVGAIAVAVPMRTSCPARHPSPKKSEGPRMATTASLPTSLTTDSFTPPSWIYITLVAKSPWEYTFCNFRYTTTFLDTPAESSKAWASKGCFPVGLRLDFFLVELAIAFIKHRLRAFYQNQMA